MEKTKIGEREVPIKPGAKTIVRFSGDPGERWRRMAGAKGYEKLYAWDSSAAQYMRPASAAEVEVWLDKNQKDARFVEAVAVDAQEMAIAAKYRLRPK